MRQLFETEQDRARQAATAALLAREWCCQMRETPALTEFDYLAVQFGGLVRAVVEIKSRLNRDAFDYGGTTFLNAHKRDALVLAAMEYRCVPVFVWHFRDQARYIDVSTLDFPLENRGRTDRDGLDERSAYRIPVSATTLVQGSLHE